MYLFFLFLEFLFNRTLNRFWIFVPQNPATHIVFTSIQWIGIVAMLALYVYSFLLLGYWRAYPLAVISLALVALDLAAQMGVGLKALWALPLAAAYFFPRRLGALYAIYYAVVGIASIYLGGLGSHSWVAEFIWALLPLAAGVKFSWRAAALAALALGAVAASPYMGMVLIFGLNVTVPWAFPLAVLTSLLSRDKYSLFPLLIGPLPQLSVHYLVLAVGMGWKKLG